MPKRIICRTKSFKKPTITPIKEKSSVRLRWLNSLGKRGLFDWDITIKQKNGVISTKILPFDSLDDAKQWAHHRCQPGCTIFIDGMQIISK